MKRQQLPDRSTMIGDPRGHRWRLLDPCHVHTLMRRAEIIDGPDQIHPMLQGRQLARQGTSLARQRHQMCAERGVEPFNGGVAESLQHLVD